MTRSIPSGPKKDSQPIPDSGKAVRKSAQAPSAWGAVRDAIASLYNLATLLASAHVEQETIAVLLPEIRASADVIRDGFEAALAGGDETARSMVEYAGGRMALLAQLLDETARAAPQGASRAALAQRATRLAGEIESCADLLALIERAASAVPTEVSVDLLVREARNLSASVRRPAVVVFVDCTDECTVAADPHVLVPLLGLVVAFVACGTGKTVVRSACDASHGRLVVQPATEADAHLGTLELRVPTCLEPAPAVARAVAARIGARLDLDPARCTIELPLAQG